MIFNNPVSNYDREIYWNFKAEEGLCICAGDWKLISSIYQNSVDRKLELFNICDDPFESNDVLHQYVDKVNQLTGKIK